MSGSRVSEWRDVQHRERLRTSCRTLALDVSKGVERALDVICSHATPARPAVNMFVARSSR